MLLCAGLAAGCGKKDSKPEDVPVPPSPGGASQDTVNTRIGTGLGFGSGLAPTSAQWEQVFVTGERTAIVAGRSGDEAIALRTTDGGRSWQSLTANAGKFSTWGAGADGSAVLIGGDTQKGTLAKGQRAPVIDAKVWYAAAGRNLSEPTVLFPQGDKLDGVTVERGFSTPAVLSSELMAMVGDQKRSPVIVFGAPGGMAQPDPIGGLRQKLVTAPFGRPPQLLVEARGTFTVQPWPRPGAKVENGAPIASLPSVAGAYEQLSNGPGCEHMEWSFSRIGSGSNAWIVGVSEKKSFAFKAPPGDATTLGCGSEAVVVEVVDAEKKVPQLVRCTFDGKCAAPASQPFDIWPEQHTRRIFAAATKQGVVAVMSARAGVRWGTYLASSMDGGKTFDLPRVIGEGSTERGFYEIGALISFPDRIVILLSADVTGTRRRGWYALSSSDGGQTWAEP